MGASFPASSSTALSASSWLNRPALGRAPAAADLTPAFEEPLNARPRAEALRVWASTPATSSTRALNDPTIIAGGIFGGGGSAARLPVRPLATCGMCLCTAWARMSPEFMSEPRATTDRCCTWPAEVLWRRVWADTRRDVNRASESSVPLSPWARMSLSGDRTAFCDPPADGTVSVESCLRPAPRATVCSFFAPAGMRPAPLAVAMVPPLGLWRFLRAAVVLALVAGW